MKQSPRGLLRICSGLVWVLAGPTAVAASIAWLVLHGGLPQSGGWESALAAACAALLGLWGSYWTLACLAAAMAHAATATGRRRAAQGDRQESAAGAVAGAAAGPAAWQRRLPRRAVLAVSLSLGLGLGFSGVAQAGTPRADHASQVQPLTTGSAASPQWKVTAQDPRSTGPRSTGPSADASRDVPAPGGSPTYSVQGSGPALPPIWGGGQRSASDVVVQAGDSLWRIAQRRLGPDATDADIDREWRLWYQHNRHIIGPQPDLIQPGQTLRPPA